MAVEMSVKTQVRIFSDSDTGSKIIRKVFFLTPSLRESIDMSAGSNKNPYGVKKIPASRVPSDHPFTAEEHALRHPVLTDHYPVCHPCGNMEL